MVAGAGQGSIKEDERGPVVLCSQLPDNTNNSVTNMAEYLAAEVIEDHGLPTPLTWIEHYPEREGEIGEYSLVRFSSWDLREVCLEGVWRFKVGSPKWSSPNFEDLEAFLDGGSRAVEECCVLPQVFTLSVKGCPSIEPNQNRLAEGKEGRYGGDMELKKWKRNQVFEAIQAAGLAPEGFRWDDGADESCIRHLSSGAYFVFGNIPGRYVARYVAGDDPVEEREAFSWEAQMRHVERWLTAVKLDIEMPDLWAELRRETELLGATADEAIENTPFTPDEREEIAERLQEMRNYVRRTYSLSEEQMRVLDAKLDYLVAAAGRLGRTDWRGLFVGTMFAYILTAALPPESARHILLTFLRSIGHILGHGFPELPSG